MSFNRGNLLYITDLEPISCQNTDCCNPLKVPIRQCLAGHLFCFDCHRGHHNCMLCPDNKLFPAPSVDAILGAIMDVCPNKEPCNEKFTFFQFDDHLEERCPCNTLTCPVPCCFERFASRNLLEKHLLELHKSHVDSYRFGSWRRNKK